MNRLAENSFADIFISYVEEDSAVALEIADGLEAAGYSTWRYEVDSIPGVSYLVQTSRAIEEARAVVVLISPHSLGSFQVTKEVVRAHETEKPFIPVLISISHVEYTTRQPEWREAIGSATTIAVPAGGIGVIIPRILGGLKALGIAPSREGGEPAQRRGAAVPSTTPARSSGKKKLLVAAATVLGLGAIVAAAFVFLGGDGEDESVATDKTTAAADDPPSTTGFEQREPPETEPLDASTSPIQTSVGPVRVTQARLITEYCVPAGTPVPDPCTIAPAGSFLVAVELGPWDPANPSSISSALMNESTSSHLSYKGKRIGVLATESLQGANGQYDDTRALIIYGVVPGLVAGDSVNLTWPENPPLRLLPTV